MPLMNGWLPPGIETRLSKDKSYPPARHDEIKYVIEALRAGIRDTSEESGATDLVAALQQVCRARCISAPESPGGCGCVPNEVQPARRPAVAREHEVLQLIAEGKSTKRRRLHTRSQLEDS